MPADKSPLTIVPEIKSGGTTQPQIFILLKKKEETLEGQKRENLTDRQAGKKATKPDGDEINLPGFHNYAYSLMICQLLPSLAISFHWCTTIDALAVSLVFYGCG